MDITKLHRILTIQHLSNHDTSSIKFKYIKSVSSNPMIELKEPKSLFSSSKYV